MTTRPRDSRIRAALRLTTLALLALAAATGCSKKAPKKPDSPLDKIPLKEAVVKVGDKQIMGSWLRNFCVTQEMQIASSRLPVQIDPWSLIKGSRQILTKVVLFASEAERRGLKATDEEIQQQLAKEMKLYPSTEAWRQKLEASGMTLEERRKQIRFEILFNKYREEIVRPEVARTKANDEAARAFYEKFPERFHSPRAVHIEHIMRSVAKDAPPSEKQRERENAEKARARVTKGEKFGDVAREVSTDVSAMKGGDIGWVTENTPFVAEVKPAVLKLAANQVSEVLESPQGFHVFRAVEVKQAGKLTFDEVKAQLEKDLLEKALTIAMEKQAAQLERQTKVLYLDLKPFIGEPPPQGAQQPGGAPQGGPPQGGEPQRGAPRP